MSQVQEASLRVILAGRTGLDAALRRDPTIELLRVKTPVELIGELSQPIDDRSPSDAVVVIGPEVEAKVDATDMVGALRMINPRVRVLVSTPGAPSQPGFDGVVRPDATLEAFRELLRRTPTGAPASHVNGEAARPPTGVPPMPMAAGPLPSGFIVSSVPALQHSPSPVHALQPPARAPAPPEVVVTPAARERIVPRAIGPESSVLRAGDSGQPGPGGQAYACGPDLLGDPLALDLEGAVLESVSGPLEVHLRSTIDDRDVLAAVTAGRSPLPAAVALLRHRLGAPDTAFFSGVDAPAASVAGAPVIVGGETVGHLVSAAARPEQLADGAHWLSGWMVLRETHRQACRGALTDGLTGSYNRRFFDRFLPAAMELARTRRHDLSVLLLDVDNFKTFNDRYGHAAGDLMLNETVRLLRSSVRSHDRVCRIGGDEFAVVFFEPEGPRAPGSKHPGTAQEAAARFRAAIEAHRFPRLAEQAVGRLTISGGLATFPWDGLTAEALLAKADGALLEAKRQGKNSIVIG